MKFPRRTAVVVALFLSIAAVPRSALAQLPTASFTIEEILASPFVYDLTASRAADRVAWIENEQGMRNVYTAALPDLTRTRLTSTMRDDGVDLSEVQLSDDGSVAIFIRGHERNQSGRVGNPSGDAEGGRREIWAVATDGSRAPWRVVAADQASLSPDGEWVLYLRDGFIYRAPVDPGTTDAATIDSAPPLLRPLGVNSSPTWSPDGSKIAFVTERSDQRDLFPDPDDLATHSFVVVYDISRRSITYLEPGVDFDSSPVWSPDGTQVAFIRRPGLPFGARVSLPEDLDREGIPAGFLEAHLADGATVAFWVADATTGEGHQVWAAGEEDGLFAQPSGLRWAGDRLLFEAEADGWARQYSVSATGDGGHPIVLTPGEGEVEHISISPDGAWLYYTSNVSDLDRRDLWRVPVGGGVSEQLTTSEMIETFPQVLPGGEVVLLQSGPRTPISVAVLPAAGGSPRIVGPVPSSDFPAAEHVAPETVLITAADGIVAHSLLFLPDDMEPGERRPALVFVHGGPGMQTVLGYHYQGSHGFYHMTYGMTQYFVNKGYIVISVNYRAGTGYGRSFRTAPELRDRGNAEYRDILAAGLWLRDRPDVDPERIGIWGLSYGGWLTGQALSRNSDLFKAGVSYAGVQYRASSLDPENLGYQSSPAYNIEKWTSPILIVHGDDDRNVAFGQTVGLVQLLRAHNIEHELIVYPDDTHYYQLHDRWVRAFEATDRFFDRYLLGEE